MRALWKMWRAASCYVWQERSVLALSYAGALVQRLASQHGWQENQLAGCG